VTSLPIMDPFSYRNYSLSDVRTESTAVQRAARDLIEAGVEKFPFESLCQSSTNVDLMVRRAIDEANAAATQRAPLRVADLNAIDAAVRAQAAAVLLPVEDCLGDWEPLQMVVRVGGKIEGGWVFYGIRNEGGGDVSAYAYPISLRLTGGSLAAWIAKSVYWLLKKRTYGFEGGVSRDLVEIRFRAIWPDPPRQTYHRIAKQAMDTLQNDSRLIVTVSPVPGGANLYAVTLA